MTYTSNIFRKISLLVAMCSLVVLTACSSAPVKQPDELPAMHTVDSVVKEDVTYNIDVYDPWEGMNRGIYRFNAGFDRYVFLPVVGAYTTIMPDFAEDGVTNFFSNISDITHLINSALQLKPKATVDSAGRLLINTTVGILGLFDVATKWGIYEHEEDFGQTLGHYGVGNGPYIVLPILGPSNLRDTAGLATDAIVMAEIDPLNLDDHSEREVAYYLLNSIDARHRNGFRYYQSGSPFEYEMIRMLYTDKRELDIER